MSPRLTLTFDNGPTPGVTDRVLDELAIRGLQATFFMIGRELARDGGRDIARRVHEAGHRIGNHTMTHSVLFGATDDPSVPEREIAETQRLLGGLADPDRLFRPWGDGALGPRVLSRAAVDLLTNGGYTCVLWNSVPHDWDDPDGWVERARADIRAQDWTVLVLHDIAGGAMDHLGQFLDGVLAEGVEVVSEFPDDCVPIRRGVLTSSVSHLMP